MHGTEEASNDVKSHGDVNYIIDSSASGILKEICPRGNNEVVILYFLIHDTGLLFMLECIDWKLKYMCEYINKYRVPSKPLLD